MKIKVKFVLIIVLIHKIIYLQMDNNVYNSAKHNIIKLHLIKIIINIYTNAQECVIYIHNILDMIILVLLLKHVHKVVVCYTNLNIQKIVHVRHNVVHHLHIMIHKINSVLHHVI